MTFLNLIFTKNLFYMMITIIKNLTYDDYYNNNINIL